MPPKDNLAPLSQILRIEASLCSGRYAAFIGMLEEASRDNLEFLKEKAIRALAQLLQAKPEQEARLLAALVNKLGDPSRKLASNVRHHGLPTATNLCLSALAPDIE